jgi:hypothetical protein
MNIVDDEERGSLSQLKSKTQKFQDTGPAFMLDSNQNPEFFGNENQQSQYSDGSETSEEFD